MTRICHEDQHSAEAITLAAMGVRVIVTRHPESGFRIAWRNRRGFGRQRGRRPPRTPDAGTARSHDARCRIRSHRGLRVALVGDIVHSRVARSNVLGLLELGADLTLVRLPTLLPAAMARASVRVERDLDAVLLGLDALTVLRIQQERIASAVLPSLDDYASNDRLDARRLAALRPGAIVMHPGPYNRGVEFTEDAFAFAGGAMQQVASGVFIRMAVLDFLVNGLA